MKQRTEKNGSKNDDWATPDHILDWVREQFGEFFDPCPLKHDLSKWNGLEIPWKDVNFVNPPYNNAGKVAFIKKAYEEYLKGKIIIMLMPVSTDIAAFHEIILPNAEIIFIKGRVKFKGYNTKGEYVTNKTGQSGSILVIFGKIMDINSIDFNTQNIKKEN